MAQVQDLSEAGTLQDNSGAATLQTPFASEEEAQEEERDESPAKHEESAKSRGPPICIDSQQNHDGAMQEQTRILTHTPCGSTDLQQDVPTEFLDLMLVDPTCPVSLPDELEATFGSITPLAPIIHPVVEPVARPPRDDDTGSVMLCRCFPSLTSQICRLRTSAQEDSITGLDTVLRYTQASLESVSTLVQCRTCASDTQAFFLACMVLSLTVKLIGKPDDPRIEIRVGTYQVSGRLRGAMEKLLIGEKVRSLKTVLGSVETGLQCLRSDAAHIAFLKYEVGRLKRVVQSIESELIVAEALRESESGVGREQP